MSSRNIVLAVSILLSALTSACATAPRSPAATARPSSGPDAVLVGRFGVAAERKPGLRPPRLTLKRLNDGATYEVDLRRGTSLDQGRSVSFSLRVPPGQYRLTAWRVTFDGNSQASGQDLGVELSAAPGQTTCLGDLRLTPDRADTSWAGGPSRNETRNENNKARFHWQKSCPVLHAEEVPAAEPTPLTYLSAPTRPTPGP